jgi:hypothetical protein
MSEPRKIEDEINPPLSSALVTDPEAVREEIRGEDEEISHMQPQHDLEKIGEADVVESVASEEPPKIPVMDFPDGGIRAWVLVFGAWLISFSSFGKAYDSTKSNFKRFREFLWYLRELLLESSTLQ